MYELPPEFPNDLRLRTLVNKKSNSKTSTRHGDTARHPVSLVEKKNKTRKKLAKAVIKAFLYCLTFFDFLIFPKAFFRGSSLETNANLEFAQCPSNFNILIFSLASNSFLSVLNSFLWKSFKFNILWRHHLNFFWRWLFS